MTEQETRDAIEVMKGSVEGARVECAPLTGGAWKEVIMPSWNWDRYQYRVMEIVPSINWNDVHPDYIYLFIDNVGISRMCTKRPLIQNSAYITSGRTVDPRAFSSFREGNCLSIDSLVERIRGTS